MSSISSEFVVKALRKNTALIRPNFPNLLKCSLKISRGKRLSGLKPSLKEHL